MAMAGMPLGAPVESADTITGWAPPPTGTPTPLPPPPPAGFEPVMAPAWNVDPNGVWTTAETPPPPPKASRRERKRQAQKSATPAPGESAGVIVGPDGGWFVPVAETPPPPPPPKASRRERKRQAKEPAAAGVTALTPEVVIAPGQEKAKRSHFWDPKPKQAPEPVGQVDILAQLLEPVAPVIVGLPSGSS